MGQRERERERERASSFELKRAAAAAAAAAAGTRVVGLLGAAIDKVQQDAKRVRARSAGTITGGVQQDKVSGDHYRPGQYFWPLHTPITPLQPAACSLACSRHPITACLAVIEEESHTIVEPRASLSHPTALT